MELRLNLGDPNTEEYARACDQMLELLTFLRGRSGIKLTITTDPKGGDVVGFPAPRPADPPPAPKANGRGRKSQTQPAPDPSPDPPPATEPDPFNDPPLAADAPDDMTLTEAMEKSLGLLRRVYASEANGAAPAVKALQKQLAVAKFSDVPPEQVPLLYKEAVKLAAQFKITA